MLSDYIYDQENTGAQNWGHTLGWTFGEAKKTEGNGVTLEVSFKTQCSNMEIFALFLTN